MPLPAEVDASAARAELRHGVLTIVMPKSPNPVAQRVEVAVR